MGSPGTRAIPELVQDSSPPELSGRRQIRLPSDGSRSAQGGARSMHADIDSRSNHGGGGSRSEHGIAWSVHAEAGTRSVHGGARSVHDADVGAFRRPASGAPSLRDGIASMSPVKVRGICRQV